MATAVVTGSCNFFPPHPADCLAVPAVAMRLWGTEISPPSSFLENLDANNSDHLLLAAEAIARGGVIAAGFGNDYVFLADADNEDILRHVEQSSVCGSSSTEDGLVTLVCAPEWLSEHVDMEELQKNYRFANILRFSQEVTFSGGSALGLILSAGARSGAPPHLVRNGTIRTGWTEYQPVRDLFTYVRYFGGRALMAISPSSGYLKKALDLGNACESLNGLVSLVINDPKNQLTYSESTVVDFTEQQPVLLSRGSLSFSEVQGHLSRWHLGEAKMIFPAK